MGALAGGDKTGRVCEVGDGCFQDAMGSHIVFWWETACRLDVIRVPRRSSCGETAGLMHRRGENCGPVGCRSQRPISESMKRNYAYRGFEVRVELEPVWQCAGGVTLRPPVGYFAVIRIVRSGAAQPRVAPVHRAADAAGPFLTEAEPEAFMAASGAGQRRIDNALLRDSAGASAACGRKRASSENRLAALVQQQDGEQ